MLIIETPEDLRAGDLMFGPIHGATGAGVGAAQLALAIAEPGLIWKQGVKKWFRIRHAGVVSQVSNQFSRPTVVQAMPGGVEEVDIDEKRWNNEYVYLRPMYSGMYPDKGYSNQGALVADAARSYINRPYDFLTYGAIPAYRRGIRTKAIETIISDTDTMMCSRLVDAALCQAGWHLFQDGRLPGNVTPSELYRRVLDMPYVALSRLRRP